MSDSMGVGMMIVTIGASCRVGSLLTFVVFVSVVAPFYFHHWEEKFTGELILGQFDGPTESQVFVIVLHVWNGVCEWLQYDFWSQPVWAGYSGKVVYTLGFCGLCVLSSLKLQLRLWSYVRQQRIAVYEALSVGFPFITFYASAVMYTLYTPALLRHHAWDESRLLFFFLTILFGYLTSRLIVQRVCQEPSPIMYPINLPLFLVALHRVAHVHLGVPDYFDPHVVLKVLAAMAFVQCLH